MASHPETILTLPVLPMRNTVLFPHAQLPLTVGRPKSLAAVEAALATEDRSFLAVAQREAGTEEVAADNLYTIGTRAVIRKAARGDGAIQIFVQGLERVVLLKVEQSEPYLKARVRVLPFPEDDGPEVEALQRALAEKAARILELSQPQSQVNIAQLTASARDPLALAYLLASMLNLDADREQAVLEAPTRTQALQLVYSYLSHEVQVLELRQKITSQAENKMSAQQHDYLLRQQLRAIQDELGESSPEKSEAEELRRRLGEADLPAEVRKEAERELGRLERMNPAAPDFQVTRTYLDLVLELPWRKGTEEKLDLTRAREVLDEDHFGLERIKERILEHLAVLKLNPKANAPILCLAGPPGVGKTSLGQSIARALGRKFERLSLGGLHDEAELRGHRRTYIGAMPGRVLQGIRRAGANNPVLMLDEVDKLGRDYRGDPAAALLEILDPAQNATFRDNYLDLPFDLSKVFFITTANTLDTVPRPLLDRMEILRLPGYSEEEKLEIARRYLVPRRISEVGLTAERLGFTDEAIRHVIAGYTREAGVRELERTLGRLARKVARRFAEGNSEPVTIGPDRRAAQSYVWAHAAELGINPALFHTAGLHIHVPAGAVPKDGPSAGVAMITALAALYTRTPARGDTALTGEITLTGLVLPIGGVKEKVLAARRAGLRRVILPKDNEKDLAELPAEIRQEMEFILAARVEDVLAAALPGPAARPKLAVA
jgi:ATP-dependent Lon protease